MTQPLMPKATAVWLVDNTALTFEQISEFCGLHELEIQAIADGDVAGGMQGLDPVINGQIRLEEIRRCEADPTAKLQIVVKDLPQAKKRGKGARYTPVSKRGDRPDAIAWLLKFHPELSDAQISKLIGTTKPTIISVRDKTHWNSSNIKTRNPVHLGLCSLAELEKVVQIARAASGTVHAPVVLTDEPIEEQPEQEKRQEYVDPFANFPKSAPEEPVED
ncbi:DUF1013 domain-containing protein [Magnetospira thiophila]